MKAYEIIGYAYEGALYHEGCEPEVEDREELAPVFACTELEPLDYCDKCLSAWVKAHPGEKADPHVYLDESAAADALNAK